MDEMLAIDRPAHSDSPCADAAQNTGNPVEIEIKLAATPAMMDDLRAHPLLGQAGPTEFFATTYFDTPDKALAQAGASLRLRRSAKGCEQTLKVALERKSHIQRGEWNHPLPPQAAAPDPAAFPAMAAQALARLVGASPLVPYAQVTVAREYRQISFGASLIEIAFDLGHISPAGPIACDLPQLEIAEIELELREGIIADLLALALELPVGRHLQWSLATKAARARMIGKPAQAMLAKPLALVPAMNIGRAVQAIGWACLGQLLANSALVIAQDHPAALHQTRVALRRLRAALALFAKALWRQDSALKPLRDALRGAAHALAPARDLHVLRMRLLADAAPDQALVVLLAQAEGKATAQARDSLASPDFQRLLLQVAHWLEAGDWRHGPRAQDPLPAIAVSLLDRQHGRIKGARRRLAGMSDAALHDLRIEVKKLRYAADFFCGLAPDAQAAAAYEDVLVRLQDALGDLQDQAQAQASLSLALRDLPKAQARLYEARMARHLAAHAPPRAKLIARAARLLEAEKACSRWWRDLGWRDLAPNDNPPSDRLA